MGRHTIRQMPVMAPYQDIVGPMRGLVHDIDGKQDGDPLRGELGAQRAGLDDRCSIPSPWHPL
jgi:hypothetical protein